MGYLDQLGIAAQSDYDTEATVTRFYEWNSDSLAPTQGNILTDIRGSQFHRTTLERLKALARSNDMDPGVCVMADAEAAASDIAATIVIIFMVIFLTFPSGWELPCVVSSGPGRR